MFGNTITLDVAGALSQVLTPTGTRRTRLNSLTGVRRDLTMRQTHTNENGPLGSERTVIDMKATMPSVDGVRSLGARVYLTFVIPNQSTTEAVELAEGTNLVIVQGLLRDLIEFMILNDKTGGASYDAISDVTSWATISVGTEQTLDRVIAGEL